MILKKGQRDQELPERIEPRTARLYIHREDGSTFIVNQVAAAEIVLDDDTLGTPIMYAIISNHNYAALRFSPVPDRDYKASFYYCPREKVI